MASWYSPGGDESDDDDKGKGPAHDRTVHFTPAVEYPSPPLQAPLQQQSVQQQQQQQQQLVARKVEDNVPSQPIRKEEDAMQQQRLRFWAQGAMTAFSAVGLAMLVVRGATA